MDTATESTGPARDQALQKLLDAGGLVCGRHSQDASLKVVSWKGGRLSSRTEMTSGQDCCLASCPH